MNPENPALYKLDEDDRLQIPKAVLPVWFPKGERNEQLFCVPIHWYRQVHLLSGHELEGWCLWCEATPGTWLTDPRHVAENIDRSPTYFALRTLMYPAKYDSRGRFSCAGVFNAMLKVSGKREFWIAHEAETLSIWTNAAFNWSYSRLAPP